MPSRVQIWGWMLPRLDNEMTQSRVVMKMVSSMQVGYDGSHNLGAEARERVYDRQG
jgi:hypothetical protein